MEHIGELEGFVADGLPRVRTLAVASFGRRETLEESRERVLATAGLFPPYEDMVIDGLTDAKEHSSSLLSPPNERFPIGQPRADSPRVVTSCSRATTMPTRGRSCSSV
jgi:hypothetical protein